MQPHWRPVDGDTRQCPKCRHTLVFRSRYPILLVGSMLERTGSEPADRIRYERGWVCRNGACDYREADDNSGKHDSPGGAVDAINRVNSEPIAKRSAD
jgi:hypothetical protein